MAHARDAAALFAHLLAVYLLLAAGHRYSVDGYVTYQQAKRIAFHGSVHFDPPLEWQNVRYAASPWDEGLTLAYVPWLTILGRIAFPNDPGFREVPRDSSGEDPTFRWAGAVLAAITAATALLLDRFGRTLGLSPARARCAALIFSVTSPALSYQKQDFAQPLAALWLLCAVMAWHRLGSDRRMRTIAAFAGALGLLVMTRSECLLFVVPLLVAASAKGDGKVPISLRAPLTTIALLLPFVLTHLAFGYLETGGLGPGRGAEWFSGYRPDGPLVALAGLWISPARGLVVFFPLTVFVPVGLARMRRAIGDRLPLLLAALVAVWSVGFATWPSWAAGDSWGCRFFVPLLPLLALAAPWPAERPEGAIPRTLRVAAIAVGFTTSLTGVLPDPDFHTTCSQWPHDGCWSLANHPLAATWTKLLNPRSYDLFLVQDAVHGGLSAAEMTWAVLLATLAIATVPAVYGPLGDAGGNRRIRA